MKVRVTIGTTYCGCPSESFDIEVENAEDFYKDDSYSTEILNAITCEGEAPHYFIDYDIIDDDDYDMDEEDDFIEED